MPASLAGAYDGFAFGDGTAYHVAGMFGFFDLPEVVTRDQPRAFGGGVFPGEDSAGGMAVTLELAMIADTPGAYDALVDALVAATPISATEKALQVFGSTRYIYCRPRKRTIPIECGGPAQTTGLAVIEFFASNPVLVVGTP